MVVTLLTTCKWSIECERIKFVNTKNITFTAVPTFFCDKCRTERTHNTCNIRTDNIFTCQKFKTTKYSVVVESTALNNDISTHLFGVTKFYNLVKSVSDNGIGKTCTDVTDSRTLFLGLFNTRIHKHRTTRTKVNGIVCHKCLLWEWYCIKSQTFRKCLNEWTTARWTGLVKHNAVDYAVSDFHTFHILTADVDDKINTRWKIICGFVVGDSFNFAFFNSESSL